MLRDWLKGIRTYLMGACAALLVNAGVSRAQAPRPAARPLSDAELRATILEQGRQIQELRKKIEDQKRYQTAGQNGNGNNNNGNGNGNGNGKKPLDDDAVKKIVAGYLKDHPGAGMPASVQTGYKWGQGFSVASSPDPKYTNWDDDSKIPFELRFKGRIQLDYYNYRVTDTINHQTNRPQFPAAGGNIIGPAQFSQLEIKRLRLIWEGNAFTPDLRFNFTLDGNTRGLGGTQNNRVIQTAGSFNPAGNITSPNGTLIGGGVTVDHAVRLFEGWVAYDWHPCWGQKGCGPDCPDGTYIYSPTVTFIAGKLKPFFALEEVFGSGNQQMVEYSATDWYFDAEDDNLQMGAGVRVKALDDRFYMQALVTNGNESQFPNTQMDELPGFNIGFWYDLGGTWNPDTKKWELFGDCLADVDYSCHPVFRVGGAANIVPMDRRSLYGDLEQSRIFVMSPGPGGTRLINVLSGDATTPNGAHAVDEFDAYSYEAFACAKYKGFSIWTDWYLRTLNNFRTTPNGLGNIIYQDTLGPNGAARNALFPTHALLDYGGLVQGGYFIIPKKLELVARVSFIRGESGDINGTGKRTTVTIPGVGAVDRVDGAFRQFHEFREYAVGVNYYFKRQLLKWQTDFSVFDGGNPAGGGVSPAGFIAGNDGWMLRTQIQLAF
jgi:hypothetical protein